VRLFPNADFKESLESYIAPVIIKIFKATGRMYGCADSSGDLWHATV
jgi:hypothetical protein